jgi:hypothetical protein
VVVFHGPHELFPSDENQHGELIPLHLSAFQFLLEESDLPFHLGQTSRKSVQIHTPVLNLEKSLCQFSRESPAAVVRSAMPPHLRPISRLISAKSFRLPWAGATYPVRLLREGDRLGGRTLSEPVVAFFASNAQLVHELTISEFEDLFSADLADHRHGNQELHASANPPGEPSTLFGGPSLSPLRG